MLDKLKELKLNFDEKMELMGLDREKKKELSTLRKEEMHKEEVAKLENTVEVEELKAKVRKAQNKDAPKQSNGSRGKSGFAKFQDYARDFANAPSAMGEMNLGGLNGRNTRTVKKSKGR